jgi:hypothetical protein
MVAIWGWSGELTAIAADEQRPPRARGRGQGEGGGEGEGEGEGERLGEYRSGRSGVFELLICIQF